MRVPLEAYLRGPGSKVYSLVVGVPFSPIDIDLGRLTRGQWNPLTDRFRVWYLPEDVGPDSRSVYYLMVRKFDPRDGVLLYAHVVASAQGEEEAQTKWTFTVGIMSNDDVKARSMLNSMLDLPPSFHRRSEVRPVERRWRGDPDAVMRFMANIHSTMAQMTPGGKAYTLKFDPPPGMMGELKRNLGTWWK
ncbi:MAG TPA: hypothetical protein VLU91_08315 [Nitrososphaerales archaeon]|nr:hypothetical protein [Nitrososphaerales archaeon]